jgi:microcystin-dependent protein
MSDPYLSEIRIMAFNFAPRNWALCNGQLLPINQNQALFSLLGTMYGGNGSTNFALPNLQGQVPIHVGEGHSLAERGGQAAHTLTISEMPLHPHIMNASGTDGNASIHTGHVLAATPSHIWDTGSLVPLHPSSVSNVGGSQAHENRMPLLTLNFCIALIGVFPSRT